MNPNLLKVCGTLAGLGFATALFTSLLICFCIADYTCTIIVAIILLALGGFYIFWAIKFESGQPNKNVSLFVAVFSIFTGICLFFVTNKWNVNANYFNKFVIYWIAAIDLSSVLALQWHFLTGIVFREVLDQTQFTLKDENIIYIAANLLTSLFIALVIPATSASTNDSRCGAGIVNSIGIWFVGAIISGLLGIKLSAQKGNSMAGQAAVYDQVNE